MIYTEVSTSEVSLRLKLPATQEASVPHLSTTLASTHFPLFLRQNETSVDHSEPIPRSNGGVFSLSA